MEPLVCPALPQRTRRGTPTHVAFERNAQKEVGGCRSTLLGVGTHDAPMCGLACQFLAVAPASARFTFQIAVTLSGVCVSASPAEYIGSPLPSAEPTFHEWVSSW
jgi:hypothetical protein